MIFLQCMNWIKRWIKCKYNFSFTTNLALDSKSELVTTATIREELYRGALFFLIIFSLILIDTFMFSAEAGQAGFIFLVLPGNNG